MGTDEELLFAAPYTMANGTRIQSQNDATNALEDLELRAAAFDLVGGNVGIGTATPATLLHVNGVETVGLNGGTGGQITLNGATSGSVALSVAAAAGSGTVFQLPATNGTNAYYLQTNGSGVTSWAAGTLPSLASTDVWVGNGSNVATATATTGTGNVVMSASPTFTGTITAAAANFSGNVGIGTTGPGYPLDVQSSVSAIRGISASGTGISGATGAGGSTYYGGTFVSGSYSAGLARADGYAIVGTGAGWFTASLYDSDSAVHSSSDRRLKTDIVPVNGMAALETIGKLNPVLFRWRNPSLHDNHANSGGFIAQEMQKIFPIR